MSEPTRPDPSGHRVVVGDLLVATPSLLDPNFEHAVVLVLDHDRDGALGVVLNRPTDVPVGEILPDWSLLAGHPDVLFSGGPVSSDSALAVGASVTFGTDPNSDIEPMGFRRLYDDVGIVDLDTPTTIVGPTLSHLRIFAGYAGWDSEQLSAEIHAGSWYVVPSVPADLFGADPLGLWKRVLRRQPGELAWVSTRPHDPSMN
ncbi:MAG: YqgE/AlgH family protein [Nocardioidaceae bacterium]